MGVVVKRFDVFLVQLNPTIGREIQKVRPCVVISPDEMNQSVGTVIVAPMTSKGADYPSRVSCIFEDKSGQIILDQIRCVDKVRLIKKLGKISEQEGRSVLKILAEMFAE